MNLLKDRILKDGKVYPNNVLKVDSFMNHQIDPLIMKYLAEEFYQKFKDAGITKILTIEASGIAPAILTASLFNVPMLFAKKTEPSTMQSSDKYESIVRSYTKNTSHRVIISKQYMDENDVVLIIDDFLANGEAALGLIDLVKQAKAKVAGVGICIEKSFQVGRSRLDETKIPVHSVCRIASLADEKITFLEE